MMMAVSIIVPVSHCININCFSVLKSNFLVEAIFFSLFIKGKVLLIATIREISTLTLECYHQSAHVVDS